MRIAASEKMGYYPTPPKTLELLTQLLRPANKGGSFRFLDPCAGQGDALQAIAAKVRESGAEVKTFGVELSQPRAEIASTVLDTCVSADWSDITCAHNSFSLLLLNPPYDDEIGESNAQKNRLEYIFLRNTLKTLQAGGLLIYVVPLTLLQRPNVAKFLAAYYRDIRVFKLPAEEFVRFGQTVLFANRKQNVQRDDAEMNRLIEMATSRNAPCLSETTDSIEIHPSTLPDAKFFLRKVTLYPTEVYGVVESHGAHGTQQWRDLLDTFHDGAFQPVVPLRVGHVGSLISSGQMGTVLLNDKLAKGRSVKVTEWLDDNGNRVAADSVNAARARERFETRVFTLERDGQYAELKTVADLQDFLEENAASIAQVIAERYDPLYSEPTREEWTKLSGLLKHKRLPGRKKSGLLPAQKHVAIAASRAIRELGWVDIVAEMGCGKTAMSLATLELLPDAYPAIVLSPGHIVSKWAREIEEVVPGAKGVVVDSLADLMTLAETYQHGDKVVAVTSKERAKLGSGWETAVLKRTVREQVIDNFSGELQIETRPVLVCAQCGNILRDGDGIPLRKLPNKRLFCTEEVQKWAGDPHDNTAGTLERVRCGTPLFEKTGLRRWPLAHYIRTRMKGFFRTLIADEFHLYKGKSTDQSGAYHDLVMATEQTINLTGTLFGGKSTDLFWLRYRIDTAVRQDFDFHDETRWAEMYGRLERTVRASDVEDGAFSGRRRWLSQAKEIPGISPAIFGRLLKSCIFMRIADLGFKLPDYDEEIVRIDMEGVQREQYDWLQSTLMEYVSTGWDSSKEDRGIAQKLLGVWLQNCLGRVNSGFRDETVMYSVNKNLKLPVPVKESELHDWMGSGKLNERPLVSDFLQEVDSNAIKPDDIVLHPESYGEYALHLEPVTWGDDLLPKEEWLVDYCQKEQQQQRKALVYVRQTGTRDIQPRLKTVLEEAGLRAVILPNSVSPKKREAWIREHAPDVDVLITNPKKVETGLDLVMFSTAIFYEIDYSLFTIWQAMRRVWRLGQTQPVKVLFPVYNNSMESAALALMGQKMQAALLLYGDNAASAITDEAGSGSDFTAELAAKILDGEELSTDGLSGILKQTVADGQTESLWDELDEAGDEEAEDIECEAAENGAATRSWMDWLALQAQHREAQTQRALRRQSGKAQNEAQLSLF